MVVEIDEKEKMLDIWVSEINDEIQNKIKTISEKFKGKNYLITTYISGKGDLEENILKIAKSNFYI